MGTDAAHLSLQKLSLSNWTWFSSSIDAHESSMMASAVRKILSETGTREPKRARTPMSVAEEIAQPRSGSRLRAAYLGTRTRSPGPREEHGHEASFSQCRIL